jgi:cobalt-zinc-cadmium efflux system outer membrane protein
MLLPHRRAPHVRRTSTRESLEPTTTCRAVALRLALVLVATTVSSPRLTGQTNGPPPKALSLRELLDTVRAMHPLVGAAQARVRAARGARTTAGIFANPVLAYNVENARLPGRDAPPMDREVMTTATLPLEPLYQRGAHMRRADAELRVATADALAEQRGVMIAAAHAFYRTALAQVARDAAYDLAAWFDSLVAYNRARVGEGVTAEADLIRTELERDRATAEATMQEAELARARAELAAFLGDHDHTDARQIVAAIDAAPFAPPDGNTGPDRALDERPDVRAARDRTFAAQAGITSERTMLIRQLGATAGTKRSAGFTSLMAGVSLPFPLFDQNRGEIARSVAERDAARFELAAVERTARADLAGATEAARLLTDRATTLGRPSASFLARADEARRIALGAYREGAAPLVQVLDAARAWGETRLTYYRLLFAQHQSVLELFVAQGRDPSITPATDRGPGNR